MCCSLFCSFSLSLYYSLFSLCLLPRSLSLSLSLDIFLYWVFCFCFWLPLPFPCVVCSLSRSLSLSLFYSLVLCCFLSRSLFSLCLFSLSLSLFFLLQGMIQFSTEATVFRNLHLKASAKNPKCPATIPQPANRVRNRNTYPKAPCSVIVATWASKGLPHHNFGAYIYHTDTWSLKDRLSMLSHILCIGRQELGCSADSGQSQSKLSCVMGRRASTWKGRSMAPLSFSTPFKKRQTETTLVLK